MKLSPCSWWIVTLLCACGGAQPQGSATGSDAGSTGSPVDPTTSGALTTPMATDTAPSTTAGPDDTSGSTGAPGPSGALDEPVFDPGDPDHVLHFYDDFANYAALIELSEDGANPNHVGGPWTIRGEFTGDLDAADPYTNAPSVRISYPQAGSAGFNDGGISAETISYVGVTGSEETVVIEYAFREVGPNAFLGKYVDFNAGQGSIGRFDFNNGSTWPLGGNDSPDCQSDLLCQLYYDAADRPLLPGLPPESGQLGGGPPIRYVQLRTDGTFLPTVDPHANVTYGYRQNRHWGLGPDAFDWMSNRDMTGQSMPPTQMPWMVIKERFTKNPMGTEYGGGRIEHWIGETPGQLVKVIEYLGDPGEYDQGVVFVGPADRPLLAPNVNIMWPQGLGSPPDTNVLFGYLRVWSHSRQVIAG